MPTWRMKFTPLLLFSRSFSGDRPSTIDGVWSNSTSVKSHCVSAIMRISLGRAAGFVTAGMSGGTSRNEQKPLTGKTRSCRRTGSC